MAEGDAVPTCMSTHPLSEAIHPRRLWRRFSRRALTRTAWMAADLVAIAACLAIALHA
jgi:uncharacterized protein (DUF2062 family)